MLLTIDSRRTPTLRALPKPKRIVKGKPVAALLGRIVSLAASWAVLCTASSLASEKAAPNNAMVVLQQDKNMEKALEVYEKLGQENCLIDDRDVS
ncbi:MAG: hypothetical protein EBX72_11850, partial [Betaproteobacteria bacterium]|nr:hypothetical protein [Betaproteobacteria bacterium]